MASSSSTRCHQPEPSRLQRKKPASLQINPPTSSCWNVAIPLLSPLITSPTAIDNHHVTSSDDLLHQQRKNQPATSESERKTASSSAVAFSKWQHPAAPFCYEPAPFAPSFFVPV